MNNPLDRFMPRFGVAYKVTRAGAEIASITGLPNEEKSPHRNYVGFYPDADICVNDILENSSNDVFYVVETKSTYFHGKPIELKAYYQTEFERKNAPKQHAAVNYNIGIAHGSIIGSDNTATINYQTSIETLREQVLDSDSPDKEDLKKIVDLLEMLVNGQVPPSKGLFSGFKSALERNSWISNAVAGTVLSWLTTQIS